MSETLRVLHSERIYAKQSEFARLKLGLPDDAMIFMMANRVEHIDTDTLFVSEEEADENSLGYGYNSRLDKDEIKELVETKLVHIALPARWFLIAVMWEEDGVEKTAHHLLDMTDFKSEQ
ncbi:MAG: hypothetical protein ACTS9Y_00255 [Methylophilus sp.]|uniref:hypothetical protein n=1 Tax=Methylophilus sp. TaxID=29541 RepID=UPI003F9FE06A